MSEDTDSIIPFTALPSAMQNDAAVEIPVADALEYETRFDERAYLAAFPDVSIAVDAGHCESAMAHYLEHGVKERRLVKNAYQRALSLSPTLFFPSSHIDQMLVTASGYALVEGWIDDKASSLDAVRLLDGDRLLAVAFKICRMRRPDVEAREEIEPGQRVGFWAIVHCKTMHDHDGRMTVSLGAGSYRRSVPIEPRFASLETLRKRVLGLIGTARRGGMSAPELAFQLGGTQGDHLCDLGLELGAQVASGACCSVFGEAGRVATSIVIRLRHGPEAVFLQAALLSRARRPRAYELIFVLDDPDLLEHVLREAAASADIYGAAIKIVSLPSRAGFGTAIDAAIGFAEGDRLLIVDPQVFPGQPGWLDAHDRIVACRPPEETLIFGAALGRTDRSSRISMEIVVEDGVATSPSRTWHVGLLNIVQRERWTMDIGASRPAMALSGQFLSLDRRTFERLGRFGHDFSSRSASIADLCQRYERAGLTAWEHELPFVHLPLHQKLATIEEESVGLLDREILTRRWLEVVRSRVGGSQRRPVLPRPPALRPLPLGHQERRRSSVTYVAPAVVAG